MGEFQDIFKKVDGFGQLKEYAKSHVLAFALAETALVGMSRKSLEIVRLSVRNKVYRRLKKQNRAFIADYVAAHAGEELPHPHANAVWTCWLQGMESAPPIVKACYRSVCENVGDRDVVVITEDNYSEYVSLPDFILERYAKGEISRTHFSDLLRIELLAKYGGTWIDSTVFCSGLGDGTHDFILDADLFTFQCLKPGLDGHCSRISNWLMTASANQRIVLLTRALLHRYWQTHGRPVDYFIFHYFFEMAIEAYPEDWDKVPPVSNGTPHVLQLRLFEPYNEEVWFAVKQAVPFHKLSYKLDFGEADRPGTYYDIVLGQLKENGSEHRDC